MAIKQIVFHPLDSDRLIIQAKNNFLYVLDTGRLKLENITKNNIVAWTVKNPNIYYISTQTNTDQTRTNTENERLK